MAITDLTGTKWLLNESLDISSIRGLGYSVNFESNSTSYDFFQCHDLRETIYYGSTPVYTVMDGWSNQAYRTIEITGGSDVTNANLISWLQANATQIQDESNPISVGNLPIANMYFGTQQVKKVYLGNTLVWEKEAAKPLLAPTISLYDNNTALKIESANDEEDQYEIYVDDVLVKTYNKFYDFEADSDMLTKCIGRQYYTGEIVTPQIVNDTPITRVGPVVGKAIFGGAVASKITISEGVTTIYGLFDNDTTTVNVVFPSTETNLTPLHDYPQATVNIGLSGYIEYGWTTALPAVSGNALFFPNPNATNINIYIKSTIVTLNDKCLYLGYIKQGSTSDPTTTVNLYFNESEKETMTIGTNLLYTGAQKYKMTYNVYTDNASIKDALLTYAGDYCTVNVYKRNGGAW